MATQPPANQPPKPGPNSQPDPDAELEPKGPPEEEFWDRYNKRLEFPLATVAAVLAHVLVATGLVLFFLGVMNREDDRSGVPVKLIDVGGMDDEGTGSAGSGGKDDPLAQGDSDPWKAAKDTLPDPNSLPQVTEDLKKIVLSDDPTADVGVSQANAAAYTTLDDTLKKKLLGVGQQRGAGNEPGKGYSGEKGSGPGGTGANSSRARSLRWVMRFKTRSGDDYIDQLAAMGAVILVPLPPDNKQCLYFTDLRNPSSRRMATDDDLRRLADQIKFSDTRPESVRAVCDVLGVREPARSFWAFFPKGLEDELDRKERNYRGRRPEDIEETVFRVTVRGGGFEIVVDDQTVKGRGR